MIGNVELVELTLTEESIQSCKIDQINPDPLLHKQMSSDQTCSRGRHLIPGRLRRSDVAENLRLREQQTAMTEHGSYSSISSQRRSLPIFEKREDLLAALRFNKVLVVSGATGSGISCRID